MERRLVSSREQTAVAFTEFFSECEPVLRHALIASCGPEAGELTSALVMVAAFRAGTQVRPLVRPGGGNQLSRLSWTWLAISVGSTYMLLSTTP
jgi:hypothetical protein